MEIYVPSSGSTLNYANDEKINLTLPNTRIWPRPGPNGFVSGKSRTSATAVAPPTYGPSPNFCSPFAKAKIPPIVRLPKLSMKNPPPGSGPTGKESKSPPTLPGIMAKPLNWSYPKTKPFTFRLTPSPKRIKIGSEKKPVFASGRMPKVKESRPDCFHRKTVLSKLNAPTGKPTASLFKP